MENKTNSNKNNNFECFICLDVPKSPVAITCGHIFCWKCLQSWVSMKSNPICPVCRNGIDMNRVIPLYTGNNDTSEQDNRPKAERIIPTSNNRNIFRSFIDSFGFSGSTPNEFNRALPTENDVLANQIALIFCVFGMLLIFCIFYQF